MKDIIAKLDVVAKAIINIVKAIFKIFGIDELEYDLTGENYDTIKDELNNVAGLFED